MGGETEQSGWGLVLSFAGIDFGTDSEAAFCHGFEVGQLWQRMQSGAEAEITSSFHAANRTLIERAAAADGWTCEIKATEYVEWIDVTLTKSKAAKRNPHGLRVVT